jgi:hypothetical protein
MQTEIKININELGVLSLNRCHRWILSFSGDGTTDQ